MSRPLAILLVVFSPTFAACGGDDGTDTSGCPETGHGSIVVEVNGLPSGVLADVTIAGPDGSAFPFEGMTLDDRGGGKYSASALRVTDQDPIVRTVYDPTVETTSFCLKDGKSVTVTVSYAAIPSSNKLWTSNGNGEHALVAFASDLLGASGAPDASVNVDGPAGGDVAFDRDGNLWSIGPTVADPHVVRFPAASLGTSGEKERDRGINITDVACLPAIRALAFDASGNLWVSTCGDQIVRLTPADLAADGDVSPRVFLGDVTENGNLAFDSDGNLWVVTGSTISRYDADRLGASDGEPADLVLTVMNLDGLAPLTPTDLAFDATGNLWVTDFGGNLVFEVDAGDLNGTGDSEVVAAVRVTIGVTALIDRPAFDESGGLWIGLGANGVGRLSPTQLGVSTDAGDPTLPEVVITSADLGSVGRVGFYPAAAGLPLFHSLP